MHLFEATTDRFLRPAGRSGLNGSSDSLLAILQIRESRTRAKAGKNSSTSVGNGEAHPSVLDVIPPHSAGGMFLVLSTVLNDVVRHFEESPRQGSRQLGRESARFQRSHEALANEGSFGSSQVAPT